MNETIVYKLTDANLKTYKGTHWPIGAVHETGGQGKLCGPGWLHCYSCLELAVLMNPIHGNFDPKTMRALKIRASGEHKSDHGLKEGYTRMEVLEEVPVPEVTAEQRVRFAILCAKEGPRIDCERAPGPAARAEEFAVYAAVEAAQRGYAAASAWSATEAARAARRGYAAVYAAVGAARAAEFAVYAAVEAARAAEFAVYAAVEAGFDVAAIAKEVLA